MSFAFFRRSPSLRATLPAVLDIAGRSVPVVTARSARARRLTLRADAAGGQVRLTLPAGVSAAKAAVFLADHGDWLAARVAGWPTPLPIAPGVRVPFGDREIAVVWSADLPRTPLLVGDRLEVGGPSAALAARIERWLRAEAARVLAADSAEIAARIGLAAPPVRVGDPRGRWGSCSAAGGLAYSWRLIMAPVFVRRAVAAHEVAHLVHHDHGPAFRALAERLSGGDAKRASRWLAANGASLHWVGRV